MATPLNIRRAAQVCGVTEGAIRRAIQRGEIRTVVAMEGSDGEQVLGIEPSEAKAWRHPTAASERLSRRGRRAAAATS